MYVFNTLASCLMSSSSGKVLFFAFLFDGWMESVHFARADTMIDFQILDRKIQDFKKPENSSGNSLLYHAVTSN